MNGIARALKARHCFVPQRHDGSINNYKQKSEDKKQGRRDDIPCYVNAEARPDGLVHNAVVSGQHAQNESSNKAVRFMCKSFLPLFLRNQVYQRKKDA